MSRKFLADCIQNHLDISRAGAFRLTNGLLTDIAAKISQDGKLSIPSFGTFRVRETKARAALNPKTGEKIRVADGATVRWKASPILKKAVAAKVYGKRKRASKSSNGDSK